MSPRAVIPCAAGRVRMSMRLQRGLVPFRFKRLWQIIRDVERAARGRSSQSRFRLTMIDPSGACSGRYACFVTLALTGATGRAELLLPQPVGLDLASMPIVHAFSDAFELSATDGAYLLVNAS